MDNRPSGGKGGFLDTRIEKTERAIKQAFLTLRAKKPLEKIKVKDLCALACINKSTFYAHYQDIFALSTKMEQDLIEEILSGLPLLRGGDLRSNTDWMTQELFRAFARNLETVQVLFSGSRQGLLINQIEHGLRERIAAADPTFLEEPARGIVLSFCVHGCYYAFMNNNNSESQMDEKRLVALLGAIARATLNIEI